AASVLRPALRVLHRVAGTSVVEDEEDLVVGDVAGCGGVRLCLQCARTACCGRRRGRRWRRCRLCGDWRRRGCVARAAASGERYDQSDGGQDDPPHARSVTAGTLNPPERATYSAASIARRRASSAKNR